MECLNAQLAGKLLELWRQEMNLGNAAAENVSGEDGLKNDPGPISRFIQAQAGPSLKNDLLEGKSADERKTYPGYAGLIGYFRDALFRVSHVSWIGNQQHNPGQPLHWARGKSTDELDCIFRHLSEVDLTDRSDVAEAALAAVVWRALAALQKYLEWKYGIRPPVNARSND